jgi:hypothetical protein
LKFSCKPHSQMVWLALRLFGNLPVLLPVLLYTFFLHSLAFTYCLLVIVMMSSHKIVSWGNLKYGWVQVNLDFSDILSCYQSRISCSVDCPFSVYVTLYFVIAFFGYVILLILQIRKVEDSHTQQTSRAHVWHIQNGMDFIKSWYIYLYRL